MENALISLIKQLRADSAEIASADSVAQLQQHITDSVSLLQRQIVDIRDAVWQLQRTRMQPNISIRDLQMALNVETAKLSAKLDEVMGKLNAAEARDGVQAQLITDLKAIVAQDNEAEATVDAVIAKLDEAGARLDALDPAPVTAPVEPTPVPEEPAPTPAEPAPEPAPEPAAVEPAPTPADPVPTEPVPPATTSDAPVVADSATKIDSNS